MRLVSVTGADARQAMARLRATLGDGAIIVATTELEDGGVRITGAVERDDLDLAELLAPSPASAWSEQLSAVARHHELPETLSAQLEATLHGMAEEDPLGLLTHACHSLFHFQPLPVPAARPLLLAGPPGAGKTASVAKLAARAVLAGHQPLVLSTDTARAGGVAQLETLLAPLGLAPQPAPDPSTLRRLVAGARAMVLIDSPGVNPFRSADLGQLSQLLAAGGAELVLVLAAGGAVSDSAEIGHTFAALGCRRLLATKLDAARRYGGLLTAAAAGLAFGEVGIGPTIGRGLGPPSARGLARLLLHAQSGERGAASPPTRETAA